MYAIVCSSDADSRPTNLTTTPAPAHHNTTVLFIIIIIVVVTISSSNVGEFNVKRALHPIINVLWIWLARYQYGSRYPANTEYAVGSISYCLLVPTFLIQEPVVYYVSALRKPDIFTAYKVPYQYYGIKFFSSHSLRSTATINTTIRNTVPV